MSKKQQTETIVQQTKTNLFPVIALLILNLLAILLAIGILMVRTQSLVDSGSGVKADRMGQIKLDQGNVVIDLLELDAASNRHQVSKQLVMRQADFVAGYSSMEDFMRQMIEKGFVKARVVESGSQPEQ